MINSKLIIKYKKDRVEMSEKRKTFTKDFHCQRHGNVTVTIGVVGMFGSSQIVLAGHGIRCSGPKAGKCQMAENSKQINQILDDRCPVRGLLQKDLSEVFNIGPQDLL